MILDHEKIGRIKTALKFRPKGMSISEIAHQLKMNRNSVAKYLEILLISGQVEAKVFGTSKVYTLSRRIPVSAMMRLSSDMILMINSDGDIIEANDVFLQFAGLKRDDIIGKPFSGLEHALFSDIPVQEKFARLGESTAQLVESITRRNGQEYHLRAKLIPTTFDDGSEGVTVIIEDVSESRRAERALKDSEQLYRSVLENIQDVYYRSDRDGNLTMASPSWASLLGYSSPDECIGRNIAEAFYMEPKKRKEFLDAVFSKGLVSDYEVVLKKKDGTPLFVSTNSHLYYDSEGSILGVEGIFRDISERRAATEKIHQYIRQLEFLSKKLLDFISLPLLSNVYERIASDLQVLLPDAMILVNSFNPATGMAKIESAVMNQYEREILVQNFGRDLVHLELPIDAIGFASFRSGSLYHVNLPLYEVVFKAIPEPVCEQLAKAIPVGDVYAIGFIRGNEILGNATILLHKDARIPDPFLVETYARQASIVLQRYTSDEARRKSEEVFVNIAHNSPLPIAIIEPDGRYSFINSSFTRLFGYDLDDFHTGREWFLLAFPDPNYRKKVIESWKSDLEQSNIGDSRPRTYTVQCKDLTKTEIIFRPVTLSDGRQCVIYEDITERREAERTRQVLSSIVESTEDAVIGKDINGIIISWNRAAERLYGYSANEVLGRHIAIIIPYDRQKEMEEILSKIQHGDAVHNLETKRVRKDRSVVDVAVTISPIADESGFIVGASTIAREITGQKAEERLRESEEKYRSLVENIAVGVYRSTGDPKGRFIWGNSTLVSLLGYATLDNLLQVQVADLFAQENGRQQLLEELKRTGFVKNRQVNLRRPDGTNICVLVTALARFNAQGEIICINGLVEDITGRRNAENQILTMTKEINDIIEFLPDATFIIDDTRTVVAWNSAMERLYGMSREKVLGRVDYASSLPASRLHPPLLIDLLDAPEPVLRQHYANAKKDGLSLVADVFVPSPVKERGTGALFRIKASPLSDAQGGRIGAIQTIRDITDSLQLQAFRDLQGGTVSGDAAEVATDHPPAGAARQPVPVVGQAPGIISLIYLSNALRMAQDAITILDLSARCIWVNDALVAMISPGNSDAVVGKSIAQYIATEHRKPALDVLSDVRKQGYAMFPLSLITPAGRLPVEASVSIVADDGGSPLGYMAIIRRIPADYARGGSGGDLHPRKPVKRESKV